ncbi:MAG: hypothetical protein AB1414_14035 [bacterium]
MAAKRKTKKKRKKCQSKYGSLIDKLKEKDLLEGKKVVFQPSREVKMSEEIENFVEPYIEFVNTYEDYNKLISLAVVAWNAALLPEHKRKDMLNEIIANLSFSDTESLREIIETMIDRKRRYFSDNKRFVVEYHLSELRKGFHLSIASTL